MAKANSQNEPANNYALGFKATLWADAGQRAEFTLPNVAEIIGKFGGADRLRNAVNQLQSLLYAA